MRVLGEINTMTIRYRRHQKNEPITFQGFNPARELERIVSTLEKMKPSLRGEAIKFAEEAFYDQVYTGFQLGYISTQKWMETFTNSISANPFERLRRELQEE